MKQMDVLNKYLERADECLAQAEDLERQAEELGRQARELKVKRETYLDAAELFRPLLVTEEDDLTDLVVDFTGCASMLERLIRLAEAAEGRLLNTTKAAQCLIDNGQTKSKLENYRTEVNRALVNNPEVFARVSTGTYRYIGSLPAVAEPELEGIEQEVEQSTEAAA